jgi:hypothetical protein
MMALVVLVKGGTKGVALVKRNLYTEDEMTCCAYAALYDADEIGGVDAIRLITGRSYLSILAKIRNYAALLDAKGVPRDSPISALSGTTTGQAARETNWEVVEPITRLSEPDLRRRCLAILRSHGLKS